MQNNFNQFANVSSSKDSLRNLLSSFLCFIVAMVGLLSNYESFIPGIDIGTLLVLVFIIASTFYKISFRFRLKNIFPLYIVFFTPILLVFAPKLVSPLTLWLRYGRMLVFLIVTFFLGFNDKFIVENKIIKWIRVVIYISFVFIVVQRVVYITSNVVIKNPLLSISMSDLYANTTYGSGSLFRPCAFFLEPSQMAMYCAPFLIYSVFKTRKIKDVIITIISILCTGAGTGVFVILATAIIYVFVNLKKNLFVSIFSLLAFVLLAYSLYQIPFFQKVIFRLISENVEGGGNATTGRIGNGYIYFSNNSILIKIFGYGYGNIWPNEYFNGFTYLLNTMGIVGVLFFCVFVFYRISYKETWKQVGLIVFWILSFFSQTITPASLMFYSFIYTLSNNSVYKDLR